MKNSAHGELVEPCELCPSISLRVVRFSNHASAVNPVFSFGCGSATLATGGVNGWAEIGSGAIVGQANKPAIRRGSVDKISANEGYSEANFA